MSQEVLYLKKQLVTLFKELGQAEGGIPRDETSKKRLKQLVETRFLMDARAKEYRKVTFCELLDFFP